MAKSEKKDLIIIGAGPGGYSAAFRAADLGLEVTLIDPEVNPGGVCLYRGCIPSKALLHVAKSKHDIAKAAEWGLLYKEVEVDLEKINNWKNKVVEKLTKGLGQLSHARRIEYIRGKASFHSEHELLVKNAAGEESVLTFEKTIIATGSSPATLPNITIDHDLIIDSDDALELKEIPKNMLIIGGGYIGLELGAVYASLGSKVSIAEMTSGYLPGVDRDLIEVFARESKGLFEELYFETFVEDAKTDKKKVKVKLKIGKKEAEKSFDKVLVAVGRKPNSDNINLGKAGVETDEKGFIKVDSERRTTRKNIFAIGDLCGKPLLAHKASHEGRIVAELIAGKAGAAYDPKAIPAIVFCNPEIAWCGLTETEANEKEIEIKVVKFPWSASGRAATTGINKGMTKLIIDPESGIIVGGGVVGVNAGSLIAEIVLAVEMASTAEDLALTIHAHPTLSETIMEAAEIYLGEAINYLRK